eukprot:2089507-Pleurochrysis_carterae.AAC.1
MTHPLSARAEESTITGFGRAALCMQPHASHLRQPEADAQRSKRRPAQIRCMGEAELQQGRLAVGKDGPGHVGGADAQLRLGAARLLPRARQHAQHEARAALVERLGRAARLLLSRKQPKQPRLVRARETARRRRLGGTARTARRAVAIRLAGRLLAAHSELPAEQHHRLLQPARNRLKHRVGGAINFRIGSGHVAAGPGREQVVGCRVRRENVLDVGTGCEDVLDARTAVAMAGRRRVAGSPRASQR